MTKIGKIVDSILDRLVLTIRGGKCDHNIETVEYDYCQFKGSFTRDECTKCKHVTRIHR